MFIDLVVHHRLSKAWFVPFIVTVAPVPDQVDHEVFVELMAVGERRARRFDAGDRIICIDVDDGNLESFCHIAGVQTAA